MSNFAFKKVSVCSFTNSVIRSVCILVGSEREIFFDQGNLRKKIFVSLSIFALKKLTLGSSKKSVFQSSQGFF